MPFDGTSYHEEMSTEEKALRHALRFFNDESKWEQHDHKGAGPNGSYCVGRVLIQCPGKLCNIGDALGLAKDQSWSRWNDTLPDFATMITHLETRIAFYVAARVRPPVNKALCHQISGRAPARPPLNLKQIVLVVVGPGRQVGL